MARRRCHLGGDIMGGIVMGGIMISMQRLILGCIGIHLDPMRGAVMRIVLRIVLRWGGGAVVIFPFQHRCVFHQLDIGGGGVIVGTVVGRAIGAGLGWCVSCILLGRRGRLRGFGLGFGLGLANTQGRGQHQTIPSRCGRGLRTIWRIGHKPPYRRQYIFNIGGFHRI